MMKTIIIRVKRGTGYNVFGVHLKSHARALQKLIPLFIAHVTVNLVNTSNSVARIQKDVELSAVFMKTHEILHAASIKAMNIKRNHVLSVKKLKWLLPT